MDELLNYISYEDEFFIRLTTHVTSFGFKGLPKDVHFSISHHPAKDGLNFHVTRNTEDNRNKPQIVIFTISKLSAPKIIESMGKELITLICEPLFIPYYQKLSKRKFSKRVLFIPYYKFDDFRNDLKLILENSSIRKKRRIKIAEQIGDSFTAWSQDESVQAHLLSKFERLPKRPSPNPVNGFLFSPLYTGQVIISNGQYFRLKPIEDLRQFLGSIIGGKTMNSIVYKTLLAIKRVSIAKSYADTKKHNNPVCL